MSTPSDLEPNQSLQPITRERLGADPMSAFGEWLDEANRLTGMSYPNATCLSTVDVAGRPEGRIVLLKGVEERGFVFYTNYRSAKGRSLDAHPYAALTFYWDTLARQVRVRGPVEKVSDVESDNYFASRPRGSRIGAWASMQSEAIEGREVLESAARETGERFAGVEVPRPPHWGGFRVVPAEIEFWQAREDRLHDRFRFQRPSPESPDWRVDRLSP